MYILCKLLSRQVETWNYNIARLVFTIKKVRIKKFWLYTIIMNRTNNPNSMVPFNNVKIQLEQQMTVLNPTDQGLNQEHPQAASIAQLFNTFGSTTQTSSSDTEVQKIAALMREYIEENKLNDFLVVPVSNQQTGNYGAVAF